MSSSFVYRLFLLLASSENSAAETQGGSNIETEVKLLIEETLLFHRPESFPDTNSDEHDLRAVSAPEDGRI